MNIRSLVSAFSFVAYIACLIFLFIFYYLDASTRKYLSKTRIKSYILEVASEQQREIG